MPIAGCLLTDADVLPTTSVSLLGSVTESEVLTATAAQEHCGDFGEPFAAATRFSLVDADGKTWSLLFPTQAVPPSRFSVGQQLDVSFKRTQLGSRDDRVLVIRQDGTGAALVSDQSVFPVEEPHELDLIIAPGEQACPWTPSACSDAYFHTYALFGEARVDDPCGSTRAGLTVTSRSYVLGMAQALCGQNTAECDGHGRALVSVSSTE